MTYDARVVGVMIASPGDVPEERAAVRQVLAEWNDLHSLTQKLVLLPLGWETHCTPLLGERPQQIVNETIVVHADIVVAMFNGRVGSPTGKERSGTLEEIKEQQKRGKPVMVYFAEGRGAKPFTRERRAVDRLRSEIMKQGLIGDYSSVDDFREKFRDHIQILLAGPHSGLPAEPGTAAVGKPRKPVGQARRAGPGLSRRARELLGKAANCADGKIAVRDTMTSTRIIVDLRTIFESRETRKIAGYNDALRELTITGLMRCESNGIDEAVYSITKAGSEAARRSVK